MSKQSDFLSVRVVEKEFAELSKDDVVDTKGEEEFYSKSEIDSFLSEVAMEIKDIEEYASYVHNKNQQLVKENDELKRGSRGVKTTSSDSAPAVQTIERIVSYAEQEAESMRIEAEKTSSHIVEQGKKQAKNLVKQATIESKEIKEEASRHLDTIEDYQKEMMKYLEEYNQDVKSRSESLKAMASELEQFAKKVENTTAIEFQDKISKKII